MYVGVYIKAALYSPNTDKNLLDTISIHLYMAMKKLSSRSFIQPNGRIKPF